jgi:hypothetical protein
MRIMAIVLLIFIALGATAQDEKMHFAAGFSGGTLNTPGSISSGFSFSAGRDIFRTPNSSISICTNLKIGTQDPTGLVFPVSVIVIGAAIYFNDPQALQGASLGSAQVRLFTEIPLLVHYNYGLGSNNSSDKRFGFYAGGGVSYLMTGFTDISGKEQGISFMGLSTDFGLRFRRNLDINFARISSFQNAVAPIGRPAFYECTFSWSFGK